MESSSLTITVPRVLTDLNQFGPPETVLFWDAPSVWDSSWRPNGGPESSFNDTSRAKGEGRLDFWMQGRRLADYIRLVRPDNLFLFVGTLSPFRSMGPELFTMITKHWIYEYIR